MDDSLQTKCVDDIDVLKRLEKYMAGIEDRIVSRMIVERDKENQQWKEFLQQQNSQWKASLQTSIATLETERQKLSEENDFLKSQLYSAMTDILTRVIDIQVSAGHTPREPDLNFDFDNVTNKDIDSNVSDLRHELNTRLTSLQSEVLENINTAALNCCDKLKQEIKDDLAETRNNVVNENRDVVIRHVGEVKSDLETMSQKIADTQSNMRHELKNDMTDVLSTMVDEFHDAVDKSKVSIKEELTQMEGHIVEEMHVVDDMSRTELKHNIKEVRTRLAREIHSDVDRQLQAACRDVCEVVEKEAHLTRDKPKVKGHPQEFYFQIKDFKYRVGSGVKVFSFPWHIPQFESCLKGFACFNTDGKLSVMLVDGRYPKCVGVPCKPSKLYSYKVTVADPCNELREKLVKERHDGVFDEAAQGMRPDGHGIVLETLACDQLEREGYIRHDTLTLKYVIAMRTAG